MYLFGIFGQNLKRMTAADGTTMTVQDTERGRERRTERKRKTETTINSQGCRSILKLK